MRTRAAVALFGVMALFLAACGGGGDDLESQANDAEQQSNDTDQQGGDGGSSSDSGDSSDSSGDLGDLGDLTTLDDALGDLDTLLGGDCFQFSMTYGVFMMTAGLGALGMSEDDVNELQSQLDEMQADVPDEIADDFAVVAEAYTDWMAVIQENGIMSDEASAASDALNSDDVTEAQDNIDNWLQENCS